MADTLFPKREERVPYGSGTPAKRDRKNTKGKKTGRTNRNKPTEKKRGKKDGKNLNRNALYLIGIIVILFIVFLFVRKNGSAVYIADEQVRDSGNQKGNGEGADCHTGKSAGGYCRLEGAD